MKNHNERAGKLNRQNNGGQESNPAITHLINVLRMLRDECMTMSGMESEAPKLDLRPVFNALRMVEEKNGSQQASPLVYRREQVLEMTGWSRTTLWRRCKCVGISLGRDVFTAEEIILLARRKRNSAAF